MMEIRILKRLIGTGTNEKLRAQALRIANRGKALEELQELSDAAKVVNMKAVEEVEPSIPEFLLRVQIERRKSNVQKIAK